jgi:23S rRNA (uracil1939-C5)-methyltransferase
MRLKKPTYIKEVLVSDYAAEGKSLAKVDGKVIFITGAVPGDVVDVLLKKNKKDWAEADIVHFHSYSSSRTTPFCAHFGVCGGCKWQMLPYEAQLSYKQNEVEQHLHRIGKIELPAIQPIIGSELTRLYRNKLEFTFSNKRYYTKEEFEKRNGEAAGPALGFHIPRWFDKVIEIDECHLQAEPSNEIRNTVREIALREGYSFYDIRNHEGWLRNLIVRTSTTGEVMVNICVGYDDKAQTRLLCNELLERIPAITTLLYTVNPKFNDTIFDLEPVIYFGKGFIIENLGKYQYKIGPKSFFQTNSYQAATLYSVTRDFAELTGKETLYDLYCGTGSIGIFMSGDAGKVIGVEVIDAAVKDARENALLNDISEDKAQFFTGDVVDICDATFFEKHGKPDVIITDPPRAGMHEKLVKTLLAIEAPLIVYVSCNPATQARDLQLLDEKYQVTKIQPVDMFPHTHHIENVVQLKIKTNF